MMLDIGGWVDRRHRREKGARRARYIREHQWHFKFVFFRLARWTDEPTDRWNRRVLLVCGTFGRLNIAGNWDDTRIYIYGPVTNVFLRPTEVFDGVAGCSVQQAK